MSQTRRHLLAASIAATASAPRRVHAEAGVTPKRILFGQTAAFEGPVAALGTALRAGILGGFPVVFAPGRNQGSDQVFLTVLQADGRFRQVGNLTRNAS